MPNQPGADSFEVKASALEISDWLIRICSCVVVGSGLPGCVGGTGNDVAEKKHWWNALAMLVRLRERLSEIRIGGM
jgi:hypothetical protein